MAAVFKNPVIRWIDHRLPVFSYLQHEANDYPTPKNLSYWWNFGSIAGFMLMVMIATGIFLAMQYTPHVDHAFNSVERMRCTLTPQRYITFETWSIWRTWTVADELTGKMSFGNNNPAVLPVDERRLRLLQSKGELNRAKETLAGDSRALNALVRTVEQRRRQRGLDQSCAY